MTGRGRKRNDANSGNDNAKNKSDSTDQSSVESMLKTVLTEIRDVKSSQEFFSAKHDDFLVEFRKLTHDQNAMKGELSSVSSQQKKMTTELDDIKIRLNRLEQERVATGVIIRGIEESEDALATVMQLANALEVELNGAAENIKAQWLRAKNNEDGAAYIRAEIPDAVKRNELIKAAKRNKVSTAALGCEGDDRPIFVDEISTQHARSLYAEARKLRDYGIRYVWMSNGDVLTREKDGAKVQRIDSLNQIERIKRNVACGNKNIYQTANKRRQSNDSFHSLDSDGEISSHVAKRHNNGAQGTVSTTRQHTNTRKSTHTNARITHNSPQRGPTRNNAECDDNRPNRYVLTPLRMNRAKTNRRNGRVQ